LILRRGLQRAIIAGNVARAGVSYVIWGMDGVCALLRRVDKGSVARILSIFGASVGNGCDLETGLSIHNATEGFRNLLIADECHLGKEVLLDLRATVEIRARSTISMRTVVLTHSDVGHAEGLPRRFDESVGGVTIGPDAYLGACSVILPGVSVGRRSVVGAGAVVCRDVGSGQVVVGVPARPTREIRLGENGRDSSRRSRGQRREQA
jgi:maltose O-acetyltransferase